MTPCPEAVLALIQDKPGSVCLDGAGWGPTIVAWEPVEVAVDVPDWAAAGRELGAGVNGSSGFSGGCIGYVGYGAAHRIDRFPRQPATREPESWLARYEGALTFEASTGRWEAVGTPGFRQRALRLLDLASPLGPVPESPLRAPRSVDQQTHVDRVAGILEWIAAGDCYQVNLARTIRVEGPVSAWDAWRRLRAAAKPRYGAWIRVEDGLAILSSSPELFLAIDGRRVSSLPIKGTRPRATDPVTDQALADELLASEKERAELTMIVDLIRNDLGKVAATGSVRVDPRAVFETPYVHHAAQAVAATLATGEDAWSALRACFPAGSVTGAPKLRACQRIAELEDAPRGIYCGTIGFATGDTARFNVAIRTAVVDERAGHATYAVGGGIVADSRPEFEWEETCHKAAMLDRTFGVRS